MLDTTLTMEFVPGTNIKGEVAGANWLFLLPSLELERVLCFGAVSVATLVALARVADEVVVLAEEPEAVRKIDESARRHGPARVRRERTTLALPDNSVALAVLADTGADPAELQRVLAPNGMIYFEHKRNAERLAIQSAVGAAQRYWLTPLGGEMHTAVPAQDRATKHYFLRNSLTSRSMNLGAIKQAMRAGGAHATPAGASAPTTGPATAYAVAMRSGLKARTTRAMRTTLAALFNGVQGVLDGAEQRVSGSALLGNMASRYGVLAGGAPAEISEQPPRYLRELARAAGVSIDHHRWGLSARGEYSSRKVLVFLFDHANEEPVYIVKMTRDPALNPRLENEYRALKLLEERGVGDDETLPRVAFFGHHRRLAVLGQTIVGGAPFERRSSGAVDCPHARDAIGWLTHLGARTADRRAASPLQVAEGLETLFNRFAEIYRLDPAHRQFLEAQLVSIARSREVFPLVFQHGDPGTWNVMITPAGRAAFLDWEAAEPQGMPLWDLFYFIRTYGAWSLRAAVSGDVTKGFAGQFLTDSSFRSLLVEASARYCEQTGVAAEFVEPLFYTCWMHRALKEATRLPANALDRGHYINVLRASIERREVLRDLFAVSVGV
jgi:thiamine kinase-like enzyme